jgi:hypothetical protein
MNEILANRLENLRELVDRARERHELAMRQRRFLFSHLVVSY